MVAGRLPPGAARSCNRREAGTLRPSLSAGRRRCAPRSTATGQPAAQGHPVARPARHGPGGMAARAHWRAALPPGLGQPPGQLLWRVEVACGSARRSRRSFARTWKILQASSYVIFQLTGQAVIDPSQAGLCSPCFNIADPRWDAASVPGNGHAAGAAARGSPGGCGGRGRSPLQAAQASGLPAGHAGGLRWG